MAIGTQNRRLLPLHHALVSAPKRSATITCLSCTPPNLDVVSTSPAANAEINFGSDVVGYYDYAGNQRANSGAQVNIGAYEQ